MKVGDVVQRKRCWQKPQRLGIISKEAGFVGEGKDKKRIFLIFWADDEPNAHVETGLEVVFESR